MSKITNKLGLPEPFVQAVQSDYQPKSHQYSVTTILNPIRQVILSRRYHEKVEQDVSDMIWMLFGTALHSVLENSKESDWQFKEEYLRQNLKVLCPELEDYFLSGKADLLDVKEKRMIDYKTTTVYKIMNKDYEDWRRQLLIYAWLFRQIGFEIDKGQIVALLKDHSKTKAKIDNTYPQHSVVVIDFRFTEKDFMDIEAYIKNRFLELKAYESKPDNELPLCTEEERWNTGMKFAVKKNANKRAERVFDREEEAFLYMKNVQEKYPRDKFYVEEREGEDKRCLEYCSCCQFCPYYQEKYLKGRKNDSI